MEVSSIDGLGIRCPIRFEQGGAKIMAKGLGPIGWLGVIVQILQRNARFKGFNGAVKITRCSVFDSSFA